MTSKIYCVIKIDECGTKLHNFESEADRFDFLSKQDDEHDEFIKFETNAPIEGFCVPNVGQAAMIDLLAKEEESKRQLALQTVETVKLPPPPADVQVVYEWDSEQYGNTKPNGDVFLFEVTDKRESNGQLFISLCPEDGEIEAGMHAGFEINRMEGSNAAVPCLHVHMDSDNLAFTVFKNGDQIVMRLENGVTLMPTNLPYGQSGFIIR